jgi:dienelactone hydrolase
MTAQTDSGAPNRSATPVATSRSASTRRDVSIPSGDSHCAAWLYLPQVAKSPPVVVLGHGMGATRDMRLDAYAERFAAAGIAAVAFTYRNFGDSGGEPRQLVSINQQLADWESVLTWVKSHQDLDTTRVAIWGTSFGGGHAIRTAAKHPELRAAIAQCPFTDGIATASATGPIAPLKALPFVALDMLAAHHGGKPVMIRLAGEPATAAVMTTPDSLPGFAALLPAQHNFVNQTPARVLPTLIRYRPGRSARHVSVPILFCVSDKDALTPARKTLQWARTAPKGEIRRYDAGHFDLYVGDLFERVVSDQTEFLVRHLDVSAIAASRATTD